MKVLLINPSWDGMVSKRGSRFNRKWPPLCLMNCASLLKKEGAGVEIIDLRTVAMDEKQLNEKTKNAGLIFITSSPLDRWQCPNLDFSLFTDFVRKIHTDGDIYIMGVHGTLYPKKMLSFCKNVKGVICGEPEYAVRDIYKNKKRIPGLMSGKGVMKPCEILELTKLPMPAFDAIDVAKYSYELMGRHFVLLETTRGCPFVCIFCLKAMYGSGYRKKTMGQVKAEIDAAAAGGAKNIYFIDLEFTIDKARVSEICDYLIEKNYNIKWCCQTRLDSVDAGLLKKMRQAGCTLIHYGVESGSPRILETINKCITVEQIKQGMRMTRQAGIRTACFFMFGFPSETKEDMMQTIKLAKEIEPDYVSFHVASPYPGTKLYKICGTSEMFPEAYTKEHSKEELEAMVRHALRSFYLRPGYMARRMLAESPTQWPRELKLFVNFLRK